MADMIERAARALATKHYAKRFSASPESRHVQMNVDDNWQGYADEARTVIEAMREPTAGEIDEAYWRESGELTRNEIKRAWQALIEAVLIAQPSGAQ